VHNKDINLNQIGNVI